MEHAQNILSMMHCSNVEIWHHWIVDKHKLFQFPGCCCIHSGKKCKNSAKNKFFRQDIMILKHLKDLNKDYFATSSSINYKDMPSTKVNDFFWFLEIVLFFIAQINMLLLLCVRLLVGEKEEYNLQPKLLMRWWDSNLCIQIIFSEKWSTLSLWIYLFSCLNLCKTLCGVKYKKTSHLIIW